MSKLSLLPFCQFFLDDEDGLPSEWRHNRPAVLSVDSLIAYRKLVRAERNMVTLSAQNPQPATDPATPSNSSGSLVCTDGSDLEREAFLSISGDGSAPPDGASTIANVDEASGGCMESLIEQSLQPIPLKDVWNIELFCVNWNLTCLWIQRALEFTSAQGVASSHAFDQAARALHECREVVRSHPLPVKYRPRLLREYPTYTTEAFLSIYKAFLLSQSQRTFVCQLIPPLFHRVNHGKKVDNSDCNKITRVGTGAIKLMENFLSLCRMHQNVDDACVNGWKTSATAWKLLLQIFVDYFGAIQPPVRTSTTLLLQAKKNLEIFASMKDPTLKVLIESVQPLLEDAISSRLGPSSVLYKAAPLGQPVPLYYVPISSWKGVFNREWKEPPEEDVANSQDSSAAIQSDNFAGTTKRQKKTPAEQPLEILTPVPNKTTAKSEKNDPESPPADVFRLKIHQAKEESKKLLVVVLGEEIRINHDVNRMMDQMMEQNEVISDILSQAYITWKEYGNARHVRPYLAANNVTQLPHIAIWEPETAELVWRCDVWSIESKALLTERFAEAALSYGSFNPYEGLASKPLASPILGDSKPPTHLIYADGGFRAVLEQAWATQKWVLVNVQSDSSLASHVLNRDVWHNPVVEEIVRENFVFWQKVQKHLCQSCRRLKKKSNSSFVFALF